MADPRGEVAFTEDALLRGRLPLAQPARGYRTNVDALWLASFAHRERTARQVLDLGSGVGAIALALLLTEGAARATLVDVDQALLDLARANASAAGLEDRVTCAAIDLRAPLPEHLRHAFDLVVANPPYEREGAARVSEDERRARARVGDDDTLPGFVRATRAALGTAGRGCFVFPAHALESLLALLREAGLEPKRMRMVHPLPDAPARVVLIEAKPAKPGGLRVEAPLVAMRAPGVYGDEARAILEGDFTSSRRRGASPASPL